MKNRIDELTANAEALRAELLELDAVEEPTDEQVARSTEALAEFDTATAELDAERARVEAIERVRAADLAGRTEAGFAAPQVTIKRDRFEDMGEVIRASNHDRDLVARAVTVVEEQRDWYFTDAQRSEAVAKIEQIPGAAKYVMTHASPGYSSAFSTWLDAASRGQQPIYSAEEAEAVRAALSTSGANGGYDLPYYLDPTLIHTGTATNNPIRSAARVETIATNIWHGVTAGGVTTYWTAEASAYTAGEPTLTQPTITPGKLTAYLAVSEELFLDGPSFVGQLPGLIGEAMDYAEGTAFISGSGTNAPKGIVTAISATAGSTVTATTRGSFTSASFVDIIALQNAVAPRFDGSSTWIANKAYWNVTRQMSTSGPGSLFWGTLANPTGPELMGLPVITATDMASAFTSGTVGMILGDLSRYIIVDRIGTSVSVVDQVFNSSSLPTGQKGFVASRRVGADVADLNAFRFLKM